MYICLNKYNMVKAKKVKYSPSGDHEDVKVTVFDKVKGTEMDVTITKSFDNRLWALMQESYNVLAQKSERKKKNLMPAFVWVEIVEEAPEIKKPRKSTAKKEEVEQ